MKTVKFLVGMGVYNAGELAGFANEIADNFVKSKVADLVDETPDEDEAAKLAEAEAAKLAKAEAAKAKVTAKAKVKTPEDQSQESF